MTDKAPHETSSLFHLAERALKQPKLATKEEVRELANYVLKGGVKAGEAEREVAKKAERNPEGVEASEIESLAKTVIAAHF